MIEPECARCGKSVRVLDGYDWEEGDLCFPCKDKRIAELEAQLAERDWSPITQDNLPRVGDEVWRDLGEEQGGVAVEDVDADMQATWTIEDYKLEYWSHRRPINAPLAATYGEDKTK